MIGNWQQTETLELEGRITQTKEDITKDMFEGVINALDRDPSFSKPKIIKTKDYLYDDGLRWTTGDVDVVIKKVK